MDPALRLFSQRLVGSTFITPQQVVSWLCGLQGQDPASAIWSIGLRLPGSVLSDVEQAFAKGALVRTWPMRGTLHVVAAEDARWLLDLTSGGNVQRTARRRGELELDDATLKKSRKTLAAALKGQQQLTREELFTALGRAKISTEGQRGYHLLWDAAVHQLLCYAAPRGKEQTFALLDDWLPSTKPKDRPEALAELARRYFSSRGPSTLKDFTWWSGLTAAEARAGLEAVSSQLEGGGKSWWLPGDVPTTSTAFALPGFDEFLLGYQDRSGVLEARHADKIIPGGNGVFQPTLVLNAHVVGTWARATRVLAPFKPLTKPERTAAEAALERYVTFIGPTAPRSRRGRSAR